MLKIQPVSTDKLVQALTQGKEDLLGNTAKENESIEETNMSNYLKTNAKASLTQHKATSKLTYSTIS